VNLPAFSQRPRNRSILRALVSLVTLAQACALPAAAAPSTRPATAPSSADGPKEMLKALNSAMRDGDRDRIRSLMYAQTPLEQGMVDAMAGMAEALAELQRAALKAFGAEGAYEVTGDRPSRWAEAVARIDAADVKAEGDRATVRYRPAGAVPAPPAPATAPAAPPPAGTSLTSEPAKAPGATTQPAADKTEPVVLRQVGGEWKLLVSQLATGADRSALEQRLAELAVQTNLVREIAGEIAAGKFETPQKAADAWHSRFMQSLGPRPATRPGQK
jgi:hypothetical protein